MTDNRVLLVSTASARDLSTARHAHLEAACRLVPGARLEDAGPWRELVARGLPECGVLVFPLLLPGGEKEPTSLLEELARRAPHATLFGVLCIVMADEGFEAQELLSLPWIETLDRFYDQAVPASFIALPGLSPAVEAFQTAAALSGLFREIDSLQELRRIGALVRSLEDQVHATERTLRPGFYPRMRKGGLRTRRAMVRR